MKKRILSLLVMVAMLITMLPVSAFAAYPPELKADGTPNMAYGTITTETNTGDMNMVPTNNPNPQKLGVGINPNIAIIDYNKDGYLDMMMGSGGLIYKGSYVFYGDENSRTNNTFGKAHLVREHVFTYPSYTYDENGELIDQILFCSSTRFTQMPNNWNGEDVNNSDIIWPKQSVGTCDYDDFALADYNGDGYLDLVRGISDWGDYGWHRKFTSEGEWGDDNQDGIIDENDDNISNDMKPTGKKDSDYYDNDPQHGWIMVCLNDGKEQGSDGLPTAANFYGEAILVEAYDPENPEITGPIHTFGAPAPNFYDWDGDGDLDLLTGSFVDYIWYYENTGSATEPEYKAGKVLVTGPEDQDGNIIPENFYAEGAFFKLPDGSDFYPDQQIVRPFVFDWNDDGNFDIVYCQEDGYARVAFGTGEFTEDNVPIVEEPVFFMQESDMLKSGAFLTTFAIDWDNDGDEDLFNGDSSGYISFIENITPDGGDLTDPVWAEPVHICDTDGNEIRIIAGMTGSIQGPAERKWGYTTFSMADWDGDSDIDIVANNIWGKILWIENLNGAGEYELKFSPYQRVEVNDETPAKPEWNWWTPEPYELVTQWRTTPVAMDANGDGLCDIVMLDCEGYLSIFYRRSDGRVEPGVREIYDINGNPMRLNNNVNGSSGRTKICFTDWDSDGDLDLIMNDTVNVSWLENMPTEEMPFRFNSAKSVHSRQLVLHSTSPTACDWNKDGKSDLIVGAEDGHFYYLENNFVAKTDYAPLENNLVAHWDFESTGVEGSELLDKAVYGNSLDDLKIDESIVIENGVATIPSDYVGTHWNQLKNVIEPEYAITAGNGADVNLTGPMTIFARVKLGSGTISSGNTFASLLDKRDILGGKRSYALGLYKLSDGYGVAGIVGSTTKTSLTKLPENEWRELVAVYKPNENGNIQLEIFVSNGEKADKSTDFVSVLNVDTGAQMTSSGATELLIGRCVDNLALGVDLSFDDIRIYDAELTPEQLSRIDLGEHDVGNYFVKQGATGDGRSVNNPAPSVEQVLIAVNEDLPDANDFANIYIMQRSDCPDADINKATVGSNYIQSSFTPFIIRERPGENYSVLNPAAEHKATVRITSYDPYGIGAMNYLSYSNIIGANTSLRIGGPTIFENVALVRNITGQSREIITRGNKVEFNNVKFYSADANCFSGAPYTKLIESNPVFWTMDATTVMEGPAEIHLNSAFTQTDKYHHICIPGGAGHNVAANAFYPITYYINNDGINGNILWGPNDNNASDGVDAGYVHGGINIVVNAVGELKNVNDIYCGTLNIEGGLQIINNNGETLPEVPSNVTADKTWILNSENNGVNSLDITSKKGTFEILGGNIAFAQSSDRATIYYSDRYLELPADTYTVKYVSDASQIAAKALMPVSSEEGKVFDKWQDNGDGTMTAIFREGYLELSYYVLAGGKGTGDGRSPANAAPSVEALIPYINEDLPNSFNTAHVYIMQTAGEGDLDAGKKPSTTDLTRSSYTPWFAGKGGANENQARPQVSHKAKMIVSSYNYETTGVKNYLIFSDLMGSYHHLRLMGPTEFENIKLLNPSTNGSITACGYSVSFKNTEFWLSNANIDKGNYFGLTTGWTAISCTDNSETEAVTADQVITLNSAVPVINNRAWANVYIGGKANSVSFPAHINRNVTYRFNHPELDVQLMWGVDGKANTNTAFAKGLNIVVDNATAFEVIQNTNLVSITGGLQIINNRGTKFADVPSNVTADATWIINSEKRSEAAIDVTDVAGTFKVLGGGVATAKRVSDGLTVTSDSLLVLEPGEYNVTYTNVPYKYYVLAGGTGDGRTPETPAGSVEELIPYISIDCPNATDTAYVYIMQKPGEGDLDAGKHGADTSNYTPWIAGKTSNANEANAQPKYTHKAKMIVSSYNYEETGKKNYLVFSDMVGGMHPLRLMGPTEFKDIVLFSSYHPNSVVARGYSVTFNNTEFKASSANGWNTNSVHSFVPDGYVAVSATDGTGTNATDSQVITLNSNVPFATIDHPNIHITEHPSFRNAGAIDRNITYRFNNSEMQAAIGFGGAGAITLTKGLNIIVDSVKSFMGTKFYNSVTVNGGLQIINNRGHKFPDVSESIISDKTWIVNSAANAYGTVDVTDTAGKFDITVNGGKTPVAVDKDGNVYTATKTGEITSSGDLDPATNYQTNVYEDYIEYRRPLTNTYKKLTEDKELNVLYLGGSLTAGYGSSDKSKYSWRALTDAWLKETFPDATVNPIDRTIGETGTLLGAYRLDGDILNLEKTPAPDLMFLEYSTNDMMNDNLTAAEQPYYAGLQCETIIREVKERYPECDIVIVYTGSINTILDHRNGKLHPTAVEHDVIAEAYDVPALLPGPMLSNILKGSNLSEWTEDFMSNYNYNRDGVHLNDAGNAEYFKLVKEYLNNALLGTEHGDEKIYTELPAVISDYLFDGDRTVYPITSELIDKSEALGGSGFETKSQWIYYVYDTAAATTSTSSKFVFEFTGTDLDIVTNFKNGYHIGAKLTVSVDGGEPYEVALSDNAPLRLLKDLDSKKHTVEITPSSFPSGVAEFEIQLLMSFDNTKHTTKGTAGHAAITNYNITLPEGTYDMYYLDEATVGELPFVSADDTRIITGWTDGENILTNGDAALVSGKTYNAVTEDINDYLRFVGVQIRLASEDCEQGLRFVADKKNSFASDKFGMVVIPSKFIGDSREYSDYVSTGGNSENNIVGADKLFIGSTHEYNGKTYSSGNVEAKNIFSTYDEGLWYTTCIIGIKEHNYATFYTAKAYIVYDFAGKEYVAYSDPFRTSIYEVSRFALDNDASLSDSTKTYLESITDGVEG